MLTGIGTIGVLASLPGVGATTTEHVESVRTASESLRSGTDTDIITTVDPFQTVVRTTPEREPPQDDVGTAVVTAQGTETAITVPSPDAGSIAGGSTVTIYAGVVDTDAEDGPDGIEGEELSIEVTRPDGAIDEFTETTDANGRVSVMYSVPNDIAGQYEASVVDVDDFRATAFFDVGPVLIPTGQSGRSRPVLAGDEATFRFLLLDELSPVGDEPVTITVTDGDGATAAEETVTTDADGFASLTVAASAVGQYTVEATTTVAGTELSATESYPVSEIGYEYDFFSLDPLLAGREAAQGGRMWTGEGPLSNTEIELQYSNEEAGVNITDTVTTDPDGFFATRFETPDGVNSLDVAIETTDGRSAALGTFEDSVDVVDPDEAAPDPDPQSTLSADFDAFRVAPGGTEPLAITATDEDDEPIANTMATVIVRFGFNGRGAPVLATTTETDENGEATVSIAVPEASDNTRLNASVVLDHDGERLTDDDGVSVQAVTTRTDQTLDDSELEISLDATTPGTDEPVSGHTTYFDAQYISGRTGSIGSDRLVSDTDGTATARTTAPDDLSFMIGFNYMSRYDGTGGFRVERGRSYPGQISIGSGVTEPIEPGRELPIDVDTAAESVNGLVYGSVGDVPLAATFDTATGQPAVPIPDDIVDDSLRLRMWGLGSDGQQYYGSIFASVDPDADPAPTTPTLSIESITVDDLLLDQSAPVELTIAETAGATAEDVTVNLTIESPNDAVVYDATIMIDELADERTVVFGTDDGTDEIGPFETEGDYEATAEVTAANADTVSVSESFTVSEDVEDVPEEWTERGLSDEQFEAVTDADGELGREEMRNAFEAYFEPPAQEIDGVAVSRDDMRKIFQFYFDTV